MNGKKYTTYIHLLDGGGEVEVQSEKQSVLLFPIENYKDGEEKHVTAYYDLIGCWYPSVCKLNYL